VAGCAQFREVSDAKKGFLSATTTLLGELEDVDDSTFQVRALPNLVCLLLGLTAQAFFGCTLPPPASFLLAKEAPLASGCSMRCSDTRWGGPPPLPRQPGTGAASCCRHGAPFAAAQAAGADTTGAPKLPPTQVTITKQEAKGSPFGSSKAVNVVRTVSVLYLDADVMVTQQQVKVRGAGAGRVGGRGGRVAAQQTSAGA